MATSAAYFTSPQKDAEWVFQAGGYYGEMGQSQFIGINGTDGNTYNVGDKKTYNGVLGAGYYLAPKTIANYPVQYGVNAFYLNNSAVDGGVLQEQQFTNLSFRYHTNQLPVYAMLKMPKLFDSAFSADVGIGPNVMSLGRVRERSLGVGAVPNDAFRSRTNVTFSATAGLNMHVLGHDAHGLDCGYRFFYLGVGRFRKTTEQLLDTLKTGQSYAHALMCQVHV